MKLSSLRRPREYVKCSIHKKEFIGACPDCLKKIREDTRKVRATPQRLNQRRRKVVSR